MSHEAEESAQGLIEQLSQQHTLVPPQHPLPTPRAFLTDLLASLPRDARNGRRETASRSAAPARAAATTASSAVTNDVANPLRALHGKDRNVFLTLHVLFPNEFLPALDLLDRALVTRFVVGGKPPPPPPPPPPPSRAAGEETAEGDDAAPLTAGIHAAAGASASTTQQGEGAADDAHDQAPAPPSCTLGPSHSAADVSDAAAKQPRPPPALDDYDRQETRPREVVAIPTVYYVRSAQQQQQQYHYRSRHGYDHDRDIDSSDAAAAAPTSYEVRLRAWNCSCPAFAMSAFPPTGLAGVDVSSPESPAEADDHGGKEEFSFGGLRRGEDGMPVCKHLLACLLTERAPGLFGGSVEEKGVGVEEAAAWAAGWGG